MRPLSTSTSPPKNSTDSLPKSSPPKSVASTAAPKLDYSVSLFDALKFNGPGPELINGRLAMVGILAVGTNETLSGQLAVDQLSHISLGMTIALAIGVVYSSLAPVLKGVKQEAFGPFTPKAEITNGRAAMLGFAVLCFLEYNAGSPFF